MTLPTTGAVRLNNAALASVTQIAVQAQSAESGNPSVLAFLQSWDASSSTANRGALLIKKIASPQNFIVLSINAAKTDNTTFVTFPVTVLSSSGSFASTDLLSIQFVRTGDAGSGSVAGMTANGAMYATGATTATSTVALTDGQLLIGRTGTTPAPAALSGDITMSNTGVAAIGSGKITTPMIAAAFQLPVANSDVSTLHTLFGGA